MNTYFGKTAHLVEQARTVSHFQRAVLRIGNFLILITVGLVARDRAWRRCSAAIRCSRRMQFALILTVASIPVALPAVLSVTMAVGAERLARMKAIVSRLVSIEEMAGMDMLCTDKTGTLTKNELTLGEPQPAHGRDARRADARRGAGFAPRRARRDRRRDPRRRADSAVDAGCNIVSGRFSRSIRCANARRRRSSSGSQLHGRQGRAAGDRRPVQAGCRRRRQGERRAGRGGRRQGLPHARRRPRRRPTGRGASSASCRCSIRRATTARRPSPRPARMGVDDQDGDRRPRGDRRARSPGSSGSAATSWSARRGLRRRTAPTPTPPRIVAADGFAARLPRAQVQDRQDAAGAPATSSA